MAAIENVLERLDRVRRCAGGWYARCPAHDDRSPSLKVAVGEEGKVLLNCKVGCRTEDILSELGLEWKHLFQSDDVPPPRPTASKRHNRSTEGTPLEGSDSLAIKDAHGRHSLSLPRTWVEFDDSGEVVHYELRKA